MNPPASAPIRVTSPSRRHAPLLIAAATLLIVALFLNRLFSLRFASGDIYPTSSSRRADPIGSRALFEAIQLHPGVRVEQNLERLSRRPHSPDTTLLLLGVSPETLGYPNGPGDFNPALNRAVRDGARVVLAVQHESPDLATNAVRQNIRRIANVAPAANPADPDLTREWEFSLVQSPSPSAAPQAQRRVHSGPLPASMPWSSPWHLTNLSTAWRAVFAREDRVVVAERSLGRGSIVVLASDYPLSNEALRKAPQTEFIAWLIGPSHRIVFDETHLGLSQEPGIAHLMARYHLGGAVAGLALLAGLHLWRSISRFNPPPTLPATSPVVQGRGTAEGFLNILRRSLDSSSLTALCLDLWRSAQGPRPRIAPDRIAQAQDLINLDMEKPPRQRNPVETYRQISQILRRR